MKSNIRYTVFGWLWASALLLATACTDTDDLGASANGADGDNMVTFIVKAEGSTASTRSEEDTAGGSDFTDDTKPMTALNTIGKGTQINALIFAVYEVTLTDDADPSNLTESDVVSRTLLTDFQKPATSNNVGNITVGRGQNVLEIANLMTEGYKFQLTTDHDKYYQVAFWAQNKMTTAFDATDLMAVEVIYDNPVIGGYTHLEVINNDETRDAFCAMSKIFKGSARTTETVILKRPLAQINIGTAGWDYEGAAVLKPKPVGYTVSQLTISANSLARYYSVVKGKSLTDNDLTELKKETQKTYKTAKVEKDVVFAYDRIPAYYNLSEDEFQAINTFLRVDKEEFLRVNVDNDDKISGYVGWDEYDDFRKKYSKEFDAGFLPSTETFKYLSMVYVLVPEGNTFTTDDKVGNNLTDNATGSVIGSIKFETKGVEIKDESNTDGNTGTDTSAGSDVDGAGDGATAYVGLGEIFTIKNVPVQKNWRTNILGDSFFITNSKFKIYVVPDYCGDYNNIGGDGATANPDGTVDNGGWMDDIEFTTPDLEDDDTKNDDWGASGGNKNENFPADHDEDDDHYYPKDDTDGAEE